MSGYEKTFTVRWADCDANGHMRNTAYSEYCIDVRIEYLTKGGFGFDAMLEHGFGPVILREELDYLRELKLGDEVKVDFVQLGMSPDAARWKLQHELFRADGKKAAKIVLSGGWLDLKARHLTVPPPGLKALFDELPKAEGWEALPNLKQRP